MFTPPAPSVDTLLLLPWSTHCHNHPPPPAIAKYGKGQATDDLATAVEHLFERNLLPRLAPQAQLVANDFRSGRFYNEEVDLLLKKHQNMLRALYSRYRWDPLLTPCPRRHTLCPATKGHLTFLLGVFHVLAILLCLMIYTPFCHTPNTDPFTPLTLQHLHSCGGPQAEAGGWRAAPQGAAAGRLACAHE